MLKISSSETTADNDLMSKWYLKDENVGIQLIGNADNTGKSVYCPTADDCKIVYHDETNGDLRFFDCDDAECNVGTITIVDSQGDVGEDLSIYCPTADDCKIAYTDVTNGAQVDTALLFYDCDDATCSSGTRRVLDGDADCSLSKGDKPCSASRNAGHYPSIYCPASDNCKVAYRATEGTSGLFFADCDDATCSDGTINVVDINPDCSLDSCTASGQAEHINMYCPSSDDCKISVKNGTGDDLRFEDCDDETCNTGKSTLLDGDVGCSLTGGDGCSTSIDAGKHSVISCPSSDDCKVAYVTNTYTSIRFADCDNSDCSLGSVSYVDGESGCSLTGCSASENDYMPSIFCPTADDCKLTFDSITNRDLRFVDCDDPTCSSGMVSILDGTAGCTLTNCSDTSSVGGYSSIYCSASDDCKVEYYDTTNGDLKFADCSDANCTSGSTRTLDGNKMSQTPGSLATSKTFSSRFTSLVFVSDKSYPISDLGETIDPGEYMLHLDFVNDISSGAFIWRYQVGFCSSASNCTDKTPLVTSPDQSFTASTFSPQNLSLVSEIPVTIPGPANTKWLYLELQGVSYPSGSITVNMGGAFPSEADSFLQLPLPEEPTPTLLPTPTLSPSPTPTPVFPYEQVSTGLFHSCALKSDNSLVCWGDNSLGQSTPPLDTFTSIAIGGKQSCAIRSDEALDCWGDNSFGQSSPPVGSFIDVETDGYHTCGLQVDGTLSCWGDNSFGQSSPPSGVHTQVTTGKYFSCAIKPDSAVVCWGNNSSGQSTPPPDLFTEISAGLYHVCGVRLDGTLSCWGDNSSGQSTPPVGTFSDVSSGELHTCGVRLDGTLSCWGDNSFGQSTYPTGTFVQVSAGGFHSCALTIFGTLSCWGDNSSGQSAPPSEPTPSPTPTPTTTSIPTLTPTPTPTQPPTGSLEFTSIEDAFIHSNKPSSNFGSKSYLGVDSSPSIKSLLKFDVTGVPVGATILSADLRLHVSNSSDILGAISLVDGIWSESSVTWDNSPLEGAFISNLSDPAVPGSWSEANVSSVVSGNGVYDFYLTTSSDDSVMYDSRETISNPPTLTIEYSI